MLVAAASGSCAATGAASAPNASRTANANCCFYDILSPRLPSLPQASRRCQLSESRSARPLCPYRTPASSTYSRPHLQVNRTTDEWPPGRRTNVAISSTSVEPEHRQATRRTASGVVGGDPDDVAIVGVQQRLADVLRARPRAWGSAPPCSLRPARGRRVTSRAIASRQRQLGRAAQLVHHARSARWSSRAPRCNRLADAATSPCRAGRRRTRDAHA